MVKNIWNFFCSIRLTLYLLLALVVFLFLGSAQMMRGLPELSSLDQMSLYKWLTMIGQYELSITYWLWLSIVAIFLLALNTIACTIDRLIVLLGTQFKARTDVSDDFVAGLRNSYASGKPTGDTLSHARSLFSKHRYKTAEKKTENGWVLFGHRGRMSLLGPHIAHIGFLIFLLGHLLSFFINDKVYGLRFYEDEPQAVDGLENTLLRLEEISLEYDPQSGRPIDYQSRFTVLAKDQREIIIGPNRPLFLQGRVFYQGPYGKEITHLQFSFRGGKKKTPVLFTAAVEGEASIPGTGMKLGLGQLIPDFYITPQGKISSRSHRMDNPAIPAFIYRRDELVKRGWLFLFNPGFKKISGDGYNIRLVKNMGRSYLEMDMVHNPGALYALVGSVLLLAGLFLGFLSSHRRIWLVCGDIQGDETLRLGGVATRNKNAFARHVRLLHQQLNDK